MNNNSFKDHLENQLGKTVEIKSFKRVSGGDINDCYKIKSNKGFFFLKENIHDRFPTMFETEAKGLKILREHSNFYIPNVLSYGNHENKSYLILEWIDFNSNGDWTLFGVNLALMHKQQASQFGIDYSNYIGSLVQDNKEYDNWSEFYINQRLIPLSNKAFDLGRIDQQDINLLEKLTKELPSIFPDEKPSLLHGDLWSGNVAFFNGQPSIYDPAIYYGNREMDLAMSHLFGGFPSEMYQAYQDVYPLEKDWESRIEICQLYPLLVHVILFGGHYSMAVKRILKRF